MFFQLFLRFVSSLSTIAREFLSVMVHWISGRGFAPPFSYSCHSVLRILCLFPEEYWGLLKFSALWGTDTGRYTVELEVKEDRIRFVYLSSEKQPSNLYIL